MTIRGYPVPVSVRLCSSAVAPKVQVELKNGVTKMIHAGALSKLFSYSNLVHAVSGAVGSVVAITVFFPLDTARTRLQIDDQRESKHTPQVIGDIIKEEGIHGIYRGWFSVVSSLCLSNFVYFYTYNGLKSVFIGPGEKAAPSKDLFLGFVSGIVNVLVTTPLWVVNTRIKLQGAKLHTKKYEEHTTQQYKGILDCLTKIVKAEGVFGLWNGTMPSLLLASNPAIQFMVYEFIKRYFQKLLRTPELSGFLYFVIGAIAKAAATVLTYPLQVIQSRLRAGFSKLESTQSILQNLHHLVRTQGVQALYKGMETKLLQTVLTAALMFLTYEKIAAFIFRLMGVTPTMPKR
ncbi:peroxisomal membrane protein PMP34-like isoform X1 [Haliotis asinina]|uniref:peroxisomal membrane protein PMP34-like isoform X1 n=2 Tax=Haliotis asinina TaxID=109174 RepID=UPI0035325D8C